MRFSTIPRVKYAQHTSILDIYKCMYLSVVHIYRHTVAALDVYKINDAAAVRWIDRSFSLSTCAGSSSPAQPTKIKKEDIIYEIERERREADADGMNPIIASHLLLHSHSSALDAPHPNSTQQRIYNKKI